MPEFLVLRQAFLWGIGAQLGGQLVVATINLVERVYNKKNKKDEPTP